jgi:hypothetical protein
VSARAPALSARDTATIEARLTSAQRREVQALVEDSGFSRREAVAWALAFGEASASTKGGAR